MKVASTASATVTDTRPIAPANLDSLPRPEQVAFHITRIKWEDAHPEIMKAEADAAKAVLDAEMAKREAASEAAEQANIERGKTTKRPTGPRPEYPDNFNDLPKAEQEAFEAKRDKHRKDEWLWELGHPEIVAAEKAAEDAAADAENAALEAENAAHLADKKWCKANPDEAKRLKRWAKFAKKNADEAAARAAAEVAREARIAARQAEQEAEHAARVEKGKALARPVKPENFTKLSEKDKDAFYEACSLWADGHPEIVEAEEAAADAELLKKYPDRPTVSRPHPSMLGSSKSAAPSRNALNISPSPWSSSTSL